MLQLQLLQLYYNPFSGYDSKINRVFIGMASSLTALWSTTGMRNTPTKVEMRYPNRHARTKAAYWAGWSGYT